MTRSPSAAASHRGVLAYGVRRVVPGQGGAGGVVGRVGGGGGGGVVRARRTRRDGCPAETVQQFAAALQERETDPGAQPMEVHPKVTVLLELLQRQREELGAAFQGIIFAGQPMAAHCLAHTLNLWYGDLWAVPVTGVGTTMPHHIR